MTSFTSTLAIQDTRNGERYSALPNQQNVLNTAGRAAPLPSHMWNFAAVQRKCALANLPRGLYNSLHGQMLKDCRKMPRLQQLTILANRWKNAFILTLPNTVALSGECQQLPATSEWAHHLWCSLSRGKKRKKQQGKRRIQNVAR